MYDDVGTSILWTVADESQVKWFCPACREVVEGSRYVAAQEVLDISGLSASDELDWTTPVRFHPGHFKLGIGQKRYRQIAKKRT